MDGWLKGLIAAACVAIIAGVGFYFWQAHSRAQEMAEYEHEQSVRAGCTSLKDAPGMEAVRQFCREKGYIR
jgi:hypothetical protein